MALIDPIVKAIDGLLIPMGFAHAEIVGATHSYVKVSDKGTEAVLLTSIQIVPGTERISVRAAVRVEEIERLLSPLRKGLERLRESVFTVACPLYLIDSQLPGFWVVNSEATAEKISQEIAFAIKTTAISYLEMALDLDSLHDALRRGPRAVAGHVHEVQGIAVLLATSKLRGDRETAGRLTKRLEEMSGDKWVYLNKVKRLAKDLF